MCSHHFPGIGIGIEYCPVMGAKYDKGSADALSKNEDRVKQRSDKGNYLFDPQADAGKGTVHEGAEQKISRHGGTTQLPVGTS